MNITFDISVRYSENIYLKESKLCKHRLPIPKWIFNKYKNKLLQKNRKFSEHMLRSSSEYLLHATYYEPYFLDWIGNNPYVITVHDMIYEKLPEFFSKEDRELSFEQKKKVVTQADRVIAISQNTKQDIIDLLHIAPEKIDVIYHGTNMQKPTRKDSVTLPKRFILYVGTRYSYKNFARFVKAFSLLSSKDKELYAICTGSSFTMDEKKLFESLNISQKLMHIQAADTLLYTLYNQAEAFVFPSLYEGFGIPIIEAYACLCPAIISNTSCFPEIAADAAAYFNPYSEIEMADTIASVIYNHALRAELIHKGSEQLKLYSWEKAASQTKEVYLKALKENKSKKERKEEIW
ncbi:glycosyltransferase family 1 protein [Bacteroides cellulosilyticus]|uniref:glycosyltransferase family 4 protein n=1 Tax=Bacteroides cellulosilyticus TaxID=246787 RepID=UPI00293D94B4|nr:glycosyltransferase family 1 protein [Bacteroides cellulosilyticus]